MAKAPSKNVGASIIHPGTAVTPTAGSEGTANPSANTPSGAGQAQGSLGIPVPGPVAGGANGNPQNDPSVTALDGCATAIVAARGSLGSYLAVESPVRHVSRPWEAVVNAMRIFVTLLRDDPSIASDVDPDALEADADQVTAGKALEAELTDLLNDLKKANHQPLGAGWKGVLAAYPTATRRAVGNTKLTTTIAPVAALFKQAPRDVSAVTKAAAQSLGAVKSTNKAAKKVTEANTARQRAGTLTPATDPVPTLK